MKRRIFVLSLVAMGVALIAVSSQPAATLAASSKFEVSFPSALDQGPITGRVFVVISKSGQGEPRNQAGGYGQSVPFFGIDVDALKSGQSVVVDASVLGYPLKNLNEIPAGDYYVQAVINVYTEVHRKDGHTIWVHMDQWEGQQWNRSPGNLLSDVQKVHLDPVAGFDVRLSCSKKIPPVQVPTDTALVKRLKIQSRMLSEFWGYPIYLGATVLLPKGFDQNPNQKYPAVYIQGHFSLGAPFGFNERAQPPQETEAQRKARLQRNGRETAYEFYQAWTSDNFPRLVAVTFQHPTPYYDDSYAVNSANNGPYGDALTQELIPYLEQKFRIVPRPEGRVLTGGSTGGWESLALQVFHPKFFNGTWTMYPDSIDFRRYQMSDIYKDDNAFEIPNGDWAKLERPLSRDAAGQVTLTMRQMNQLEAVLGSKVRSCQQIAAWDAAYGPTDAEGYPRPLWDRMTGKIDKDVAMYMRDNGYDLSYNIQKNWATIGKDLADKIHIYVGDMDNYYLNLAVYLLEDFMKTTDAPPAHAEFQYGRPLKGHGWQPMSNAELIRMMAERINQTAPGLVTNR
ncbi:MAG: esterase family protein [Acidobacteriia bacterium]|nr:esterase family protein [Terriglobia bacterium]